MMSAIAVSGIATRNRPMSAFTQLAKVLGIHQLGPKFLTLYQHDYDLNHSEAILAVKEMKKSGLRFFEPNDVEHAPMANTSVASGYY
ncbi:MAG: hypothetical protein HRT77_16840 [Halioglobus sp.]|nr:hypothetical protein [Halioglobus sp.]